MGFVFDNGAAGSSYYWNPLCLAPAFAIQCNPEYALYQEGEDVTEEVASALHALSFYGSDFDFDWGDETGTADATWFEGLSKAVPDESWVGKTKSVTLTSAVLGTTTHLIRCIGVN